MGDMTRRAFLGSAAAVPMLAGVDVSAWTQVPDNQEAVVGRVCVIGTVAIGRVDVMRRGRREVEALLDARLAETRAGILAMLDQELFRAKSRKR